MAASSSREVHNIPLPPSPLPDKESKSTSRRKGKDKEPLSAGHKRRVSQKAAAKGNADADLDWDWTALTDSHVSKVPPVFTKDGSYFFSLVGPSVKIYSVATGQNVSTLTPPRPSNLITGSCNGYIHIWDFLEATLLKTIDLSQPIHHLCVHEKFKDFIFASVTRPSKNKTKGDDSAVVLKVSLHTNDTIGESSVRTSSAVVPIGKTRLPTGLAISHNGEWLVATAGCKAYVASLTSSTYRFTKYVSPERITCLAFHPSEDYFATGDAKGNIRLWYCLNDQVHIKAVGVEKKTQTASFHWHAHAVSSLVFTSNGAYLLSGGEEAVLVIWQLESGKKEFIPRIGAPINTIALSKVGREEEYLVGLADGTYLFIGASTLQVSRSYSRIRLDPAVVHDGASTSTSVNPTPLASHPASSTLILPSSHPSSLQMFSIPSSQVISELEVSPSNRVSRRDEKPLEPSRVELTVVSSSGDWMATVDRREGDGTLHGEVYVKIWSWDRQVGSWILNTRIDRPHGSQKVLDIAFSPVPPSSSSSLLLATTGADNNIKIWRLKKSKDRIASEFWVPRSTFDFRSETPQTVSWSPDGSLLSISFKKHVVLYDPLTTVPRRILTTPECPNVSSAQFVGSSGRYLAIISGRDISIWDLVLQSVLWHRRNDFRIQFVISRSNDDSFTVLCHQGPNTHASVYSCSSAQPTMTRKLPFRLRSAIAYSSQFIGISQDWSVVHFGDDVQKAPDEGAAAIGIQPSTSSTKHTLFQDIFGKSAFSGEQEGVPQPAQDLSRTDQIPSLFDGPSFMMPPLESLFDDAMSDFIKPRNVALVDTADGDGDIEMGDVDETEALPKPPRRNLDALDMEAFIGLFKQHSLQPRPQTNARPKPVTNGSSKTNGHGHDRKRPAKSKPPTKSQAPPSSSPIALNGKKRKKVD
ncbi:WD40-repeat-containing domain protein [Mucidula mucida]|nr:WD40-repeat-containing domain protein [Mucidula mucida]